LTDIPVTRTKILVPRRPATLLTRQRLLGLLHNLLDYRLTIVAAPAGYGKTSLLVDWAHHDEMPVCWYALDTLDRDFHRFIAHLIASISSRFPDFGKRSAALLHSTAADFDLDHLVTVTVNDAYEHIQEHFVLVLDDYHLVGESEMISGFLSRFVQGVD
jgi:LuxR family maltose regulon positive regulatory protein